MSVGAASDENDSSLVRRLNNVADVLRRQRPMKNLRSARTVFLFSSFAVTFLYGLAAGRFEAFPFPALKFAKDSVVEVFKERHTIARIRPNHFLEPARYDGSGVTRIDAGRMAPGFTLVQGFFDGGNEMRLMRANGSIVRRWPVRFSTSVRDTSHIQPAFYVPKSDWNVELHGGLILPDGSVVFSFERGGLVKADRCGRTLWVVSRMTHHSVEESKDGGFWVPALRYLGTGKPSPFRLVKTPYYEDTLIKVSAEGKVLTEISLLAVLFGNNLQASTLFANGMPNPELRKSPNKILEDVTHLNDVEELGPETSARFPQFSAGDLLVSERDYNVIMVIDPTTQKVKWYQQGPWLRQHDPDFEPNGRISVFSNNTDGTDEGSILEGSTILEVDPATGAVKRDFGGRRDQPMFTKERGKHQRLANGNILITESASGRVLEVDAKGEVVWEFINRFDVASVAIVTQAHRYKPDYFTVQDWACP